MNRQALLAHIRVAGYHNDAGAFTRLLVENRISRAAADKAWTEGVEMKESGKKCACHECKTQEEAASNGGQP